jgi:pre-rRNA-processing protein IPI1
MGKSAKAKKEKKKEFQKVKLKVGKTKPKAANLTDTSFKARCKNSRLRFLKPSELDV